MSFNVSGISGLPGGENGLGGSKFSLEGIGNLLGLFNLCLLLGVLSLLSILGLLELLLLSSGGLSVKDLVVDLSHCCNIGLESFKLSYPTVNPAGELGLVLLAQLWVLKSGTVLRDRIFDFTQLVLGLFKAPLSARELSVEFVSLFSFSPGLLVSCGFVSSGLVLSLVDTI